MRTLRDEHEIGLAHLSAKRLAEAEQSFRAAIAAKPGFAPAHYHLGMVLQLRGAWQDAASAFRAAIRCDPRYARGHAGLGFVLDRLGEVEEAERELRKAIRLDPQLREAYLFLGELLRGKGDFAEVRRVYELLLTRFPGDPEARFGRGFARLIAGDLASGWEDYEFRTARRGPPDPALTPQWQGEDVNGKTLLLYAEQGIGDSIQFLRCATLLARRGARVKVAVPIPLMELAQRIEGVHEIVQPTFTLPRFDCCAPLPSLPLYCSTTLSNIPWSGPYLSLPPGLEPTIPPGESGMFTVALAWAGNPAHPDDRNRSLAASQVTPLFDTPGIRWLILQRGAGVGELPNRSNIVQLGDTLDKFSKIAAAICAADLTITVDTSFAHLAGALGRPVWTLLSHAPDWRWLLHRADSPWYPSMRLFRQSSPRDWSSAIAAVSEALSARVGARASRSAGQQD